MNNTLPPDLEVTGTLTAVEWIGLRRLVGRHVALDEGAPVAMKIEQILAGAAAEPAGVSDGDS